MNRTFESYRRPFVIMAAAAISPVPITAVAAPVSLPAGPLSLTSPAAWADAFAWGRLQEEVAGWANLPADWDGMDGVAPSAAVLASAETFIDSLQVAGIRLPNPTVAGDGEVSLHWTDGDDIGTVSFLSDGHLVAYVKCGATEPLRIDKPCADVATRELFDRLARFA